MKSAENPATNVVPLPRPPARSRRNELEFLPAALEIVETPASPLGRAIAGTLVALFVIALAWACLGHIDIIATAQGKIIPVGHVKVIQPLETGDVRAIHVRDGDRVTAGRVLVELDPTVATAERNRVRHDLLRARLDVARLTALRAALEPNGAFSGQKPALGLDPRVDTGFPQKMRPNEEPNPLDFVPPDDAPAYEIARTRAATLAQAEQQAAKLAALDQQIAQKAAEAEAIGATIAKLQAGLPLIEESAEVREKVMQMQFGNRIAHLDAQLRLTEQRHELIVQGRRAAEAAAARQALEWQREQTRAEYARTIMTDLAEAEPKAAQFAEDQVKAEKRVQAQTLRAPIDGTVQQLALHTIGGVVTPGRC
jgi:membrane fusion protein, hemolysin D